MYLLASELGIPLPYAVGIMEMLWHHAAQYAPRGDIGSLPDAAIAQACAFSRKPSVLIDALVKTGWIDRNEEYRLIIHDWPEHCENTVKKWLQRNKKDVLPVYAKCLDIDQLKQEQCPASREAMAKAKALDVSGGDAKGGDPVSPDFDEQWIHFRRLFEEIRKDLIPEDLRRAHLIWRILDFSQRTLAIANLAERKLHHDPQFIPRPEKYLQDGEYKRSVIPRSVPSQSRQQRSVRAIEEA